MSPTFTTLSDDSINRFVLIQSMEMSGYRRLLGISYTQHITNDEVRETTTQAIGQHDDLLTVVKKRKLRWYGHVTRSSGLAKTILQGTDF